MQIRIFTLSAKSERVVAQQPGEVCAERVYTLTRASFGTCLRTQTLSLGNDSQDHGLLIFEHFRILEPQDSDLPAFEYFLARCVPIRLILVNRTIQFDHKLDLSAEKIGDESSQPLTVAWATAGET